MKVLVTAASKHGSTDEIAEAIGRALEERGIEAEVLAPDRVTGVHGYDAVILGSGVYAGRWLKPVKELVARHGTELAGRPVWLFSSGPIGDPPKPEGDPADVAGIVEAAGAREHRVFSGELDRARLSFPERAIVRAVKAQDGDYRDWEEIRTWATGIADELLSHP
jgi:menaquinone-dependent protoporphyrinogen oxidase